MEKRSRKDFLKTSATTAGMAAAASFGFVRCSAPEKDPSKYESQIETMAMREGKEEEAPEKDPSKYESQIVTLVMREGKEEEALETIRTLAEAVEADEPWVLAFSLYRSESDPQKIYSFETYEDEEAYRKHSATPHMVAARRKRHEFFLIRVKSERIKLKGGFIR